MIDVLKDAKDSKEKGKIKKGGLVFFLHFQHFYLNFWLISAHDMKLSCTTIGVEIFSSDLSWKIQVILPKMQTMKLTFQTSSMQLPGDLGD